jgi:Zn-finger nucleic acid-binding protein
MRLQSGNASLRCEYCKTVVTLTPDDAGMQFLEETPELECPSCAVALWNAVLAGAQLHTCRRCHGLLVRMNALEPLVEAMRAGHPGTEIPAPADPADLERKVVCPRCHQRMDSDFYAGGGNAVVSGCERDELNWLDGGALTRIVRAPQASDAEGVF